MLLQPAGASGAGGRGAHARGNRPLVRRTGRSRRTDLRRPCQIFQRPDPPSPRGALRMTIKSLAKAAARAAAQMRSRHCCRCSRCARRFSAAIARSRARPVAVARFHGLSGHYIRRAFLSHALDCLSPDRGRFDAARRSRAPAARLGEHVYIGPGCRLGLVDIEPRRADRRRRAHSERRRRRIRLTICLVPIREQGRA